MWFWILLALVLLICLVLLGIVAYRFFTIRGSGTPVVVKTSLLKDANVAWGHGIMRFTESHAELFRLASLRVTRDLELSRPSFELGPGRSPVTPQECAVLDPGELIVPFTACDSRGRTIYGEFGMDTRTHAALLSWIEACSIGALRHGVPRRRRSRPTAS